MVRALAARDQSLREAAVAEQRLQRMQQHLNLSDSQVEEIRSIREQGGGRDEVRAILTDEQIELVRESHRQRNGEHRGGPPKDQETQE